MPSHSVQSLSVSLSPCICLSLAFFILLLSLSLSVSLSRSFRPSVSSPLALSPPHLCLSKVLCSSLSPPWGAADAEIKVASVENTELKDSPFKAWSMSVYIAIHATLTARDFLFAYYYPSGPFTCIFPKPLLIFTCVGRVANTGSCVGPQSKIGQPAGCRFPC